MYDLKDVLEEVNRRDFAKFDNSPKHFFSFRHRRAMKKIFDGYTRSSTPFEPVKFRLNRKTVTAFLIVVILALFTAITPSIIISGFRGRNHEEFVQYFVVDTENCPETIEDYYFPEIIPEGFELKEDEGWIDSKDALYVFVNKDDEAIFFTQTVKSDYNTYFDNEYMTFDEVTFDGYKGFFAYSEKHDFFSLVWDNGNYIFEIHFPYIIDKNEAINIAKSTKIKKL